jgi:hypothetical protein
MQAKEKLTGWNLTLAKFLWQFSGKLVCILAWLLSFSKVHKQIANRILEPWSHIKVVASATEWDNFFKLRIADDAQPEIKELALSDKQFQEIGKWMAEKIEKNYIKVSNDYKECTFENNWLKK